MLKVGVECGVPSIVFLNFSVECGLRGVDC
jgi:hypothetical protein